MGLFKNKTMFNEITKEIKFGKDKLILKTGKIARQASGSIWAQMGDTVVLATVVGKKEAKEGQDFFPLTVNYSEKFSASGKIPGGFNKREGRPSEKETLTSRLIDRPIRPLFPEGYKNEVQIIVTVYSYDKEHQPDMIAMIASSAALAISGIPFLTPIAGARVGYTDGKYVLNTKMSEMEASSLDLVVAGTKDGVLMVESEASELNEEIMLGAVEFGHKAFQPVLKAIEAMKKEVGNEAWPIPEVPAEYKTVKAKLEKTVGADLKKAFKITDKQGRVQAIEAAKAKAIESLGEKTEENEAEHKILGSVFHDMESEIVRSAILKGEKRIDGRKTDEIRNIECEVGVLPRTHGSALFTRGETQALVSLTLGVKDDEQLLDSIDGTDYAQFMLHYNFPPFSVGECGRVGFTGRREIGHGKLGWRANKAMLPAHEDFPYTIRILSDVTESNGSSSMATTCGASLAMMDGGVPVKAPVAGIAMGLIKEGNKFEILSDIMGDEDHLGDMDFKVAGSKEGITSLQMDLKITSITFDIMKQALAQAKDGREHILGKMAEAITEARKDMSPYAPRIDSSIKVKQDKIREIIGPGGVMIRSIAEESDCKIEIRDDGQVIIAGDAADKIAKAKELIGNITAEAEIGKVYEGKVVGLKPFGAFVNIMPGTDGLLHISEIAKERVENVEDFVKEGDTVKVLVKDVDQKGKIKLSMKDVK